ncbi:MAG: UbiD family decarboxylase, partial [Anaerolineales bacterium]|nr:UbiD family decarboxylase [Anaerolineales bacterium]
MDFRTFLQQADAGGALVTITRPVAVAFELANVAHALEGRPVLFTQVQDYPGWRVCAGPCSDRKYFAMSLGVAVPQLLQRLEQALANPVPPPMV